MNLRLAFIPVLTVLAGCQAPMAPEGFDRTGPLMRPEAFFAGPTSSTGVLENGAGAPTQSLRVTGVGTPLPDGGLKLVQTIHLGDAPARERTWVLKRLDEHRYSATLTDATGPVTVEAHGNLMHLSYAMKSPPMGRMEQWLYLQPGGQTVVNEATVRLMGMVVAHLSERISREPEGPAATAPVASEPAVPVSGPGSRSAG